MRKLVLTCYSDSRTPMKRLSPESYGVERMDLMSLNLKARLTVPDFDVEKPF